MWRAACVYANFDSMMRIVIGHLMTRPTVLLASCDSMMRIVVGILERWMFMLYGACRHAIRCRTHCHVQNVVGTCW